MFARNERVVFEFDCNGHPLALVMVGALNVGSVSTVHAGQVMPARPRKPAVWHYDDQSTAAIGSELARFNLGSTVILLFAPGTVQLDDTLRSGTTLRMGQSIARWSEST